MDDNRRIRRKVRNSYIISTVSVALVLFLLGSVGFMIYNAVKTTRRMKESVSIYVMLREGTDAERRAALEGTLAARPEVLESTFVSKEQAAEEFKAEIGDDFVELLGTNPLPDQFEVRLRADYSERAVMAQLERDLLREECVAEVVYPQGVMDQIGGNINKFNLVLLMFGGSLLVISLVLLRNTVRMTIVAKRYLINTMKLVGATKWFIMKPFLWSSMKSGFCAGLIATGMFAVMAAGLNEGLPELMLMAQSREMMVIVAMMLAAGMVISALFTAFAVDKFVKMSSNKVYMY